MTATLHDLFGAADPDDLAALADGDLTPRLVTSAPLAIPRPRIRPPNAAVRDRRDRVLAAVRGGADTVPALMAAMGGAYAATRDDVYALQGRGLVRYAGQRTVEGRKGFVAVWRATTAAHGLRNNGRK